MTVTVIEKKGKKKEMKAMCRICGLDIDKGACNQQYSIITIVRDSDEKGRREERRYLCKGCTVNLVIWLIKEELTSHKN